MTRFALALTGALLLSLTTACSDDAKKAADEAAKAGEAAAAAGAEAAKAGAEVAKEAKKDDGGW